jgi:CheY-like chemotaxis protein
VANPGAVDIGADLRVQLYRMIHDNFGLIAEQAAAKDDGTMTEIAIADARLRRIPSLARQALLLTAVEGFSFEDTGRIIGRDAETVRALIADATDEIDRQTRARILIIEDEPIIAMDIEMIVRELGHDVVGVATTHREAVDEAQKHQPGLVLADIQLADNSSGIEAVQEILTRPPGPRHLHHRLSRTAAHRRPARTGLPADQAVPARDPARGDLAGAVLRRIDDSGLNFLRHCEEPKATRQSRVA